MKKAALLTALVLVSLAVTACRTNAVPTVAGAEELLKNGAPVIDVRTAGEFKARHLPGAINIPLDEVKVKIPLQFTNKSQVLLLHCRSGRRSGIAERKLREMGYTNSFNIGSFQQAEKVAKDGGA
jgi:phage shock protein E